MKKLKHFLKINKGVIIVGAVIPLGAFVSGPIGWILLAFQLTCFIAMLWAGFLFE